MATGKSIEESAANQPLINAGSTAKPLFAAIPLQVIAKLMVAGPSASQVFLYLASRASFSKAECFPAVSTIADETGCGENTVRRAIKDLVTFEVLTVKRRQSKNGCADTNLYRLALAPSPRGGTANSEGTSKSDSPPAAKAEGRGTTKSAPLTTTSGTTSSGTTKERERFVPPTVDEVAAYCRERSNGIDPEAFVAYYAAQGWKLKSGQAMQDWKSAIITWEKRAKERANANGSGKPTTCGRAGGFATDDG